MSLLAFLRDNAKFLIAGVALMFNSCAGQTFFIAIFAAQIMADFSLSNGDWGLLYTGATAASAAVMFWVGALTDRFRARVLAAFVMPGLALSCIAMEINTTVTGLFLIVFFLRLLGQGMMFQLAAVSMARWFSSRRGLALSISAMGFWIGQAALPVLFAALLLRWEWRDLWTLAGLGVLAFFPLVLWLLTQERTPQSLAEDVQSLGMEGRHWTRGEVLRSRFFWLLVPVLLGPPAWGTALFFQQVHIAGVKDWNLVEYLALIPAMTAVSAATTLIAGPAIDRFGSGRMLQLFPVFWIVGFLILAQTTSLAAAGIAFIIFGLSHGMQATLFTAFWAEYYGTKHIGAIKAASTSLTVFGSAIGPGVSGILIDLGYDFPTQMVWITGYFAVAMALVWIAVEDARRYLPRPA